MMITSPNDLPACPACGYRSVNVAESTIDGRTWHFYTCRGCGGDVTFEWRVVNPVPRDRIVFEDAGRHLTLVHSAS